MPRGASESSRSIGFGRCKIEECDASAWRYWFCCTFRLLHFSVVLLHAVRAANGICNSLSRSFVAAAQIETFIYKHSARDRHMMVYEKCAGHFNQHIKNLRQHKCISCKLRSLVGRAYDFLRTLFFPAIAFSVLFVIYYLCSSEREREAERESECTWNGFCCFN